MKMEINVKRETDSGIRFDKRDVFSSKYGYETFNFALCAVCAYFKYENTKETIDWAGKNGCGKCRLIKEMGAYDGVMTTAVCNKFLSQMGKNINGKTASIKELPDFVKLVKDENGKISVLLTA